MHLFVVVLWNQMTANADKKCNRELEWTNIILAMPVEINLKIMLQPYAPA